MSKRDRDPYERGVGIDSREPSAFRGTAGLSSNDSSTAVTTKIEYAGPAADLVASHLGDLNRSLLKWVGAQLESHPEADLTDGLHDAIQYTELLAQRHLPPTLAHARKSGQALVVGGDLLTFGDGGCGQAGHGKEDDNAQESLGADEGAALEVRYPRIVAGLRGKAVVSVACGGLHNAVCTQQGHVYTFGCADDGSLGRSGFEGNPMIVRGEKDIMMEHKFVSVACGDGQTLALSSTGEVWGWGCYKDKDSKQWFDAPAGLTGKDAQKSVKRMQTTPMRIPFFTQTKGAKGGAGSACIEITCGSCYNLARCADGGLYSWGPATCGELGRQTATMKIPDPNEPGEDMYDLAAMLRDYLTPAAMCAFAEGQDQSPPDQEKAFDMGSGANKGRVLRDAKTFGCGGNHSMVVVGDKVYSCGLNNYGQLGLGHKDFRTFLTEIRSLRGLGVVSVRGGAHHSLVLTASGELFAFGRGDSGQLGVPLCADYPGGCIEVPISPGTALAGAAAATAATAGTEELAKEHFTAIACGSNHCLALARSSSSINTATGAGAGAWAGAGAAFIGGVNTTLYSWGYGDMLALGHGKERDEVAPRRVATWGKGEKDVPAADRYSAVEHIFSIDAGGQHSAIVAAVR